MSDRAHNCWFNMQLEEFQFCVKPYSLIKKSCRDCIIDLTGKSLFFINFLLKKKKIRSPFIESHERLERIQCSLTLKNIKRQCVPQSSTRYFTSKRNEHGVFESSSSSSLFR